MDSIERDAQEREDFLAVDRFFLANQEAFREAFGKLKRMLGKAGELLDGVPGLYEASIRCGDFSTASLLHTMPCSCFVLIWTVYSHLTMATPLFISEELIVAWEACDDGTPCQCRACGYRFPKPWPKCTLCRGDIGPAGNWDRRQKAGAVN